MSTPLSDEQVELLSAYLDGEADETERARAEALLAEDPAAAAWLDEARADGALLKSLAPAIDVEALDQARRRAEATAAAARTAEPPSAWERLRAALTPSRVTGLAVPALAIVLAVLTPSRHPSRIPTPGPIAEVPAAIPVVAPPTTREDARPVAPPDLEERPNDDVTVRSLSGAPPRRTVVVPRDPETLVVAMHLPEADVDLIWMMPPGGERTRRRR